MSTAVVTHVFNRLYPSGALMSWSCTTDRVTGLVYVYTPSDERLSSWPALASRGDFLHRFSRIFIFDEFRHGGCSGDIDNTPTPVVR